MGMIKSLIYRELYISRKFYTTNILVAILFIVMGILVRLSMLYGNLAHLEADVFEITDTITYYVLTYVVAYGAFSILDDPGVILSDFRSNWRIFGYTLPIPPVKSVLAKYIIKLGAFCIAMLISIVNGALIGAFSGRGFGTDQIMNFFLLANFWLLVDVIRAPMMLNSKTEKGFQTSGMAGYFVIMAAIMLPIMRKMTTIMAEIAIASEAGELSEEQQVFLPQQRLMEYFTELHDKFVVWMPLLTAVIIVLGFVICVQVLKRREK